MILLYITLICLKVSPYYFHYTIHSLPKTKRVHLQTDENVDVLYKYLDKNYFIYLYLDKSDFIYIYQDKSDFIYLYLDKFNFYSIYLFLDNFKSRYLINI
jgi:hypothetical protein